MSVILSLQLRIPIISSKARFVFYNNYSKYATSGVAEYSYDANGNLTRDDNKKIVSITYNHLNLPQSINKAGGSRVEYEYDANGTKLKQLYYENGTLVKTTDFIANFVYENGTLLHMLSSEGRIVYKSNGNTWFTETQVKDHLGSVRAVCSRNSTNGSRITRQVDSYYPFGMNIKELSQTSDAYLANEYMYNGKMYQDEMGLGLLDYGARFYDAVLGRWHSVDPMAEKHQDYSQYAYVYNNPIRLIDPIGMDSIIFNENYECTEIYRNDNSNCGYLPDGTMFNMNEQDADNMVIYNEATKYSDLKKNGNMINKVELLPNDLVEYFLKASGSEDQNILTAYYYALTESPGGRKLDFTFAYNLADKSTMYVMDLDGKKFGQNDYNTGNSLWGAAMQRMGIDLSTALLCANLYEISRGNIGDSSDDQKSIIFGYNWATKNKKK